MLLLSLAVETENDVDLSRDTFSGVWPASQDEKRIDISLGLRDFNDCWFVEESNS